MKWDIQSMAWLRREFKLGEPHPNLCLPFFYCGRDKDGIPCFENSPYEKIIRKFYDRNSALLEFRRNIDFIELKATTRTTK